MTLNTIKPKTLACFITALPLLVAGCSSTDIADQSTQFTPDTTVLQSKDGWELVWNDEFEGDKIDLNKWRHEINCWGGGNQEQQCYTKSKRNSFVSNGFLTIRALKQMSTGSAVPEDWDGYNVAKATLPYSSARLRTKNRGDWKYGRFEVRAKLPQGQGTWPAIWMLPTDFVYGGWAASGEIDIMEAVNLHTTYKDSDADNIADAKDQASSDQSSDGIKSENRVHGTLHFGKNWPKNVSSGVSYDFGDENINPADDFHTYAIEWEKGEIRWYVDDVHYATQTQDGWWTHYKDENDQLQSGPDDAPFNQKFHMLLNLAIGGGWAANVNHKGIDPALEHADMLVDYVRVYQCGKDKETGKGCASHISANATHNSGVEEPPLLVKEVDLTAATLNIMPSTRLDESFHLSGWDDSDNDSRSITADGLDIMIKGAGNAYTESLSGALDMSSFEHGELIFDLQVVTADADGVAVKMDSGWPNVASLTIANQDLPQGDAWKSFHFKVADFIAANPAFNIANVLNPVVFEGINNNQLHIKVKNIRFVK